MNGLGVGGPGQHGNGVARLQRLLRSGREESCRGSTTCSRGSGAPRTPGSTRPVSRLAARWVGRTALIDPIRAPGSAPGTRRPPRRRTAGRLGEGPRAASAKDRGPPRRRTAGRLGEGPRAAATWSRPLAGRCSRMHSISTRLRSVTRPTRWWPDSARWTLTVRRSWAERTRRTRRLRTRCSTMPLVVDGGHRLQLPAWAAVWTKVWGRDAPSPLRSTPPPGLERGGLAGHGPGRRRGRVQQPGRA